MFNEFSDDKSDCSKLELRWCIFEFEVGERDCLASENERLTVFVCYHRAVHHSRCVEKSHFGAVTFSKRVVLSIHVQKFEQAQIGEGVRWFCYTRKRS